MSSQWPNLLGLVNPPLDNIAPLQAQLGHLPGWAIFRRGMAHDRVVFGGDDYRRYTQAGMGAICCLEWDTAGGGTLPLPDRYRLFAEQCREYVSASHACHVWIVGDAMNCAGQWPRQAAEAAVAGEHEGPIEVVAPSTWRQRHPVLFPQEASTPPATSVPIRPFEYAQCYRLVRDAIKNTPGHQHDLVLVGAVAPWNDDFKDAVMPNGDWVHYFQAVATALPAGECDGFAMHTGTQGADPDLLTSPQTLSFPFTGRQGGFRCYLDFMAAIPEAHRPLPVFLTEVSQLQPWHNANDGWIMQACEQILAYNRTHDVSPIRCLALYQWEADDGSAIKDKRHLLEDLKSSLTMLERQSIQDALWPVAWEYAALPPHIPPGEPFTIRLQFTNIGEQPMLCSGDNPVRVGYRFHPAPGNGAGGGERRIPLAADVGMGESDQVEVRLCAPAAEGTYWLHVGFVKSQFIWSTAASDMAHRLELHVAAEPEEVVEEAAAEPEEADAETAEETAPITAKMPALEMTEDPAAPINPEEPEAAADAVAVPEEPAEAVDAWVNVEILDISAFLPASRVAQPRRPLQQVNRVIVLETGVSAELPLDAMQTFFGEFGMGQIPFHFLIDPGGGTYRLQDPACHPDPYRHNMDQALVIGLAGQASDEDQARTKLWQMAPSCAQILSACMDAGMPAALEIGADTLDSQHRFSQFVQGDLADFSQFLTQTCLRLSTTDRAIAISPIVLAPAETFAAPALIPEESDEPTLTDEPAAASDAFPEAVPVAQELAGQEEEMPLPGTAPPPEPDPAPVPSEMTETSLDLDAPDLENLGYAHSDRVGVTVWATGEPGHTPLQQIRRVHTLRLKEILYHYVIDPEGRVYETRRGDRADNHVSSHHAKALHIGLQGNFHRSAPPHKQTQTCIRLLVHLSRNNRLLDLSQCLLPASHTPLRIGSEGWTNSQGWMRNVVQAAVAMAEAKSAAAPRAEDAPPPEPEAISALPPVQSPAPPEPVLPPPRNPLVQTGTQVPRIVNKVGNLAQHPQLQFPVRDLAAIRTLCLHHANAPISIGPEQLAESWLLDQWHSDHPQPGLPYHYFIHPDGTIDQCNDIAHVCASVAQGNESVIAVCLAGKFTAPHIPTPDQLEQAGLLLAWLMQKYFISLDQVVGHKDIDGTEALCPGEDWDTGVQWRQTLMSHLQRYLHPETSPQP